jgi:hypothetical protein
MFTIRAEQGRLDEVAPIVKHYVSNNPDSAAWRPGLALVYRTLGLKEECSQLFDELAQDDFTTIPKDSMWVTSMAYLTEVCVFLEDEHRAATLYNLLSPHDGYTIVAGGGVACYGAASRYLGMLSRILSEWQISERHFKSAVDLNKRLEARPWLAHTQYEYAAMKFARGFDGDRTTALTLLEEAESIAGELEMAYLIQKSSVLRMRYNVA